MQSESLDLIATPKEVNSLKFDDIDLFLYNSNILQIDFLF